MAQVSFSGVAFSYPGFALPAVRDLDLVVEDGEFLSILGPSGAGKSTVLRLLTGLARPTVGDILLAGDVITQQPAGERDIASVSSKAALYAHLTVEQNIGFAMSIAGIPPSIIAARVADVTAALGLTRLMGRRPNALGHGERQAVQLARAMVRPVGALALDEPLSHLDLDDRRQARLQLKLLQRRTGTTTLCVTQDFAEAMTISDRIAVLINGRLRQVGAPLDIYHAPANLEVARFFGNPPMNTLDAVLTDDGARVGELVLPVPGRIPGALGAAVVIGVRAEGIRLLPRGAGLQVTAVDVAGNDALVRGFLTGDARQQPLVLRCPGRATPRPGDVVFVDVLDDDHVLFFDPVSGRRL